MTRGIWPATFAILLLQLSACSGLFYYPDRELHFAPGRIGLKPQEISFTAGDGTHLSGWLFKSLGAPPARGMIVQFHGNAQNMSSHYLSLVWAIQHGYDLFVFDYRGYGKSSGHPDQHGTYLDGLAALDEAWGLHAGEGQFIVVGQSLGGAIAMRALGDFERRREVDLLVLDSTFVSYRDVARRKLASFWLTWPLSPFLAYLVSDEYSAEGALRQNEVPLVVIHDKRDPAVPFACGERIYEEARSEKEFWKLDQGLHVAALAERDPRYRNRLLELLAALPPKRGGLFAEAIQKR